MSLPASFVVVQSPEFGMKALWSACCSDRHVSIRGNFGVDDPSSIEPNSVSVEIIPPDQDYTKPLNTWIFHVNQDPLPSWWDAQKAEECVRRELPQWVKKKLVLPDETREVVCGYKIISVVLGRVNEVRDHGWVCEIRDHGQVRTIKDNGRVNIIRDHGQVCTVEEDGQIGRVTDQGVVHEVRDHGRVGTVRDRGRVDIIRDYGLVYMVKDHGRVGTVGDNSLVYIVRDQGRVNVVRDQGQ